ncbi:Outer membrane usher protein HifC [Trichinella spiralis]|uniref:Outer membrane usher protein HifC n=1 Tax=Trichinella spiralis TaxID=6334 RepID=A0ABR3KWF3_TRISP
MAHDRLAHRWLSDFGMPSIAHAYEFDIRGNPSVKCTQPYVRIEFGRYQRSAYFFPLTRGQLDSLCISVNVPWNSEDDSTTSPPRISGRFFYDGPQRHMRLQILVIKLPASRTLETTHDCLAHRWLSDFGMPSIAHAYEFDIRGNPSVKCTQPYVRIEFGRYQRSAYFFPITRGQLDSLCISVNVPWNSENDSTTSPPRISGRFLYDGPKRHMRLQILVIKLPASRTLETAHDRLAHRWLSDFGMPSIAHAYEFDIRGNPSVKCTQPYVRIEFGRYQRSAYFFPLTRGQLDSLCISVNVPWNSGIISFLGF